MKKFIIDVKNKILNINKAYKEKVKGSMPWRFLPNNLLILALLIVTIFVSIGFYIDNNRQAYYHNGVLGTSFADPILNDIFKKEIVKDNINFNEVGVKFATYGRNNDATYKFILYNGEKILYEEEFNASILKDCEFHYFYTGKIRMTKNDNFSFEIIPVKTDLNNNITILSDNNEILYSLGNRMDLFNFKILFILVFILFYFSINYIINTEQLSGKKFYLLMLLYIVPSLFLIPPYEAPDEPAHFFKAYKLSKIDVTESYYDQISSDKGYMPDSSGKCLPFTSIQNIDKVIDYGRVKDCLNNSKNNLISFPEFADNLNSTNPVSHIIPAIGIKIADIFSDSSLILFYAGRLLNLLFCFAIIYYAISVFPFNKSIVVFVATIPMLLQQMTSYSYDSILNSCAILFVSYFAYMYKKESKYSFKDWLILFITMSIMISIKVVYFPLIILLLFFDKKKAGKFKIAKILLFVILLIAIYELWNYLLIAGFDTGSPDSLIKKGNLEYLLSSPLVIVKVAYYTLINKSVFYINSLFGFFGWIRFSLDDIIVAAYVVFTGLLIISNNAILNIKKRIILLVAIFSSVGGILLALYLAWSDYGLNYVEGVQGRYFLPLFLPLLLCFMPKKKKFELSDKSVYTFINLMILYYLVLTISFYY